MCVQIKSVIIRSERKRAFTIVIKTEIDEYFKSVFGAMLAFQSRVVGV